MVEFKPSPKYCLPTDDPLPDASAPSTEVSL